MLTCSVESLAADATTSPFLRREMFAMGGYPPVAEQTSMAFSFVPFNCRVNNGCSATEKKTTKKQQQKNSTLVHIMAFILLYTIET